MSDNNKPAPLTLAETDETGKFWPHGVRHEAPRINLGKTHSRRVPAMSDEMREYMTRVLDEEFERGRQAGRDETEQEYFGNGVISLGVGAMGGAFVMWLSWQMLS
jgi:hypothetical protein